ncbi:HAMP domain-containing histidine kinase [Planomonospora sp. ID67723]|uniref:sensor histidine kinase n=1 Tax=Planomonospora sp. ID67723 TaxID=2738134 RepID=UPI0018C38237|nr:HAMP domain-containing sensor histidine kinase [Planomonospora sp. ID67723]MBG0830897.1 HAMP domain-containing histidine kinase [Planomonospora sp. ID67723]
MSEQRSVLGENPGHAARQMALVFALGTILSTVGLLTAPDDQRGPLVVIAAVALAVAAAAWWLPWARFDRLAPLALCLPVLALLSYCTWALVGGSIGTAPFLTMLFVWVGLHFTVTTVLALGPVAALAYVTPLVLDERGAVVISGAALFVPAVMGVGALISQQIGYQRRDRDTIRRMERWRAALTATLAHDVRSPLTAVQFALETLDEEDDLPKAQRHEIVTMALRQAGRIRRLATNLLDAERVDSRGLQLDMRPVRLSTAAEEAAGYLAAPVEVAVDPGLTVLADPERLEQILVNLAANAIRHGSPPIVVSAGREAPGMVAVHIRDHGPGVPEEKRDQLFARFSSADTSPDSVGLGLWITRELALAHGGDARYTPADPGACFTVVLPAGDPAPE